MDIKEAIEWIRTLTNCLNYPANFNFKEPKELAENNRKANNVIVLLQRGEEYEKKYNDLIEIEY